MWKLLDKKGNILYQHTHAHSLLSFPKSHSCPGRACRNKIQAVLFSMLTWLLALSAPAPALSHGHLPRDCSLPFIFSLASQGNFQTPCSFHRAKGVELIIQQFPLEHPPPPPHSRPTPGVSIFLLGTIWHPTQNSFSGTRRPAGRSQNGWVIWDLQSNEVSKAELGKAGARGVGVGWVGMVPLLLWHVPEPPTERQVASQALASLSSKRTLLKHGHFRKPSPDDLGKT